MTRIYKVRVQYFKVFDQNLQPNVSNNSDFNLFVYILRCNLLFSWQMLNFQHHYSGVQFHIILQKSSNMLIWYSRNISYYYQCYHNCAALIFFMKTAIQYWYSDILPFKHTVKIKKILLLSKDALNWSKVTVKTWSHFILRSSSRY